MAGFGAPETVRERLVEADAILVLGSRLSEVTHVRLHGPRAGGRAGRTSTASRRPPAPTGPRHAVISLDADADAFLRAAVRVARRRRARQGPPRRAGGPRTSRPRRASWLPRRRRRSVEPARASIPARPSRRCSRRCRPTACITTDAGNFAGWLARGFRFRRPGTFLGPTSGAMGYGLPAAIAAALWAPDRAGGRRGRRRRLRDDHGRARDRGPPAPPGRRRRLRRRAVRDDPRPPGARRSRHGRDGPRAGRLRSGRAGLGAAGCTVARTTTGSRRHSPRRSVPASRPSSTCRRSILGGCRSAEGRAIEEAAIVVVEAPDGTVDAAESSRSSRRSRSSRTPRGRRRGDGHHRDGRVAVEAAGTGRWSTEVPSST